MRCAPPVARTYDGPGTSVGNLTLGSGGGSSAGGGGAAGRERAGHRPHAAFRLQGAGYHRRRRGRDGRPPAGQCRHARSGAATAQRPGVCNAGSTADGGVGDSQGDRPHQRHHPGRALDRSTALGKRHPLAVGRDRTRRVDDSRLGGEAFFVTGTVSRAAASRTEQARPIRLEQSGANARSWESSTRCSATTRSAVQPADRS